MKSVETSLPIPYDAFELENDGGPVLRFYLSKFKSATRRMPLALYVQGSGGHSLFRRDSVTSRIRGGYQNILRKVARGRVRILCVEKPGIALFDFPSARGTVKNCSAEFRQEHTLDKWANALASVLRSTIDNSESLGIDADRILVVGHSEGGIVSARVSRLVEDVTHVALLGSNGPTQLFDLLAKASRIRTKESGEALISSVLENWAKVMKEPESSDYEAWGHPYRRWSSFLSTSASEELLHSKARMYLAHGSRDVNVPFVSFLSLLATLESKCRDVTFEVVWGGDHGFRLPNEYGAEGMARVMRNTISWFLSGRPPCP